ncbi:DUF86 domain-containing protein [Candidatus Bipolaricaulota bacterium]|nr:DUF86 domain-containing protein [Candidatus Bipolaricaulota bacterium]
MGNLDEEKILIKLDQMDGYLSELRQILPDNYEDYETIEKRRSTERLLQLAIETVIDLCNLVVSGLDLGLPAEENDLFNKLAEEQIITERTKDTLYEMRGFRNILVHEYASVDNRLVYETAKGKVEDFRRFAGEIKELLKD